MLDLDNPLLEVSIIVGITFTVIGVIMYNFPPKRINFFYGYRTIRSMDSQEAWDFAQIHSSKLMVKWGVLLLTIALISYFLPFNKVLGFIISLVLVTLSLIQIIYSTEKAIKNLPKSK